MPRVGIVLGSRNDEPLVESTVETLKSLGIDYELSVLSAHRNPEGVRAYASTAAQKGIEVIIAAAGGAAHLPGVIAGWTDLPVIGIPLPTSDLKGVDSLYSIVQMPPGVPVACVSVGKWGATNAALLAAQILGLKYDAVKKAFREYKEGLKGK
ncbi:MAG: 5-(carboxyamino)imidazole ribonucleotide mutase [Chloroflexota bacterium]